MIPSASWYNDHVMHNTYHISITDKANMAAFTIITILCILEESNGIDDAFVAHGLPKPLHIMQNVVSVA